MPIGDDEDELLLITEQGTIVRQKLAAVAEQSRAATGVRLQKLDIGDLVASVAIVEPEEEGLEDDEDEDEDEEEVGEVEAE